MAEATDTSNAHRVIRNDLTVAERQAVGKNSRLNRPRTSLANWEPAADRADPVAVLSGQEQFGLRHYCPLDTRECQRVPSDSTEVLLL